jgi:hypothetical protein
MTSLSLIYRNLLDHTTPFVGAATESYRPAAGRIQRPVQDSTVGSLPPDGTLTGSRR